MEQRDLVRYSLVMLGVVGMICGYLLGNMNVLDSANLSSPLHLTTQMSSTTSATPHSLDSEPM